MNTQAAELRTSAEIAVALADEGVPVRAIARSIKVPGEDVYDLLKGAIDMGRLLELPRDDWPPGGRHSRNPTEKQVLANTDEALHLACANRFKLTHLQAVVFIALLRRIEATKDYLHNAIENNRGDNVDPTDQKMVDVVICHIRRKLKAESVSIDTIWGVGYSMKATHRDAAIGLIAAHMSQGA